MRLDASGNLGIGTSTPSEALEISRTADPKIRFVDVGNIDAKIGIVGSTALGFEVNGSEQMRLNSSGNLGLGVTSTTGYWPANLTQTAARAAFVYSDSETNLNNANAGLVIMNSSSTAGTSSKLVFGAYNTDPVPVGLAYISATNASRGTGYLSSSLIFGTSSGSGGATERMRLDSSGNLGIGTSSPAYKLHTYVDSNTTTNIAVFENANTGSGNFSQIRVKGGTRTLTIGLNGSGGTGGAYIGTDQAQALSLYTAGGTATLDSSGNLGLGVTPSAWISSVKALDINAGASFVGTALAASMWSNAIVNTGASYRYKNTGVAAFYDQAGGSHAWFTAPSGTAGDAISFSQVMTLNASGNLGVGTTSPDLRLTVKGGDENAVFSLDTTSATRAAGFVLKRNGSARSYWGAGDWAGSSSADDTSITTAGAYNLTFGTNNTERACIDSSGNLLVGTTSYFNGTARLSITATAAAQNVLQTRPTTDITYYPGIFENSSGTTVGYIQSTNTATSYVTSSDYRLKNTVSPMTGALAKVALLKPCTYKWNADGSDGEGFIAHELAEVVPQCVTGEKDAVDAKGKPQYQGIDTSFLVATLTAAIQEQQAIINSLKARLDAANL
jgi:hypothetical protein